MYWFTNIIHNGVASTATTGSGAGATFNVVVSADGTPTLTLLTAGSGYAANDTVGIADSDLGGGGGAVITVTVNTISGTDATDTYDERLTALSTLYWVQGRNSSEVPDTISPIDVIAYTEVIRPEIGSKTYLELTVAGDKNLLDDFFTEYDPEHVSGDRELYRTKIEIGRAHV